MRLTLMEQSECGMFCSGWQKWHGMFCPGWQIFVGCFVQGGKKWHGMLWLRTEKKSLKYRQQDKFDKFISPDEGLFETCKSQNINPIYQTFSSPSVLFRS